MPDRPRPKAPGTDIPLPPPRPRQRTIPESPAPPPPPVDVAPQSATLESVDAQAVPRERLTQGQAKRSVSPAPWDPRASSPELRREVERGGDRLVRAPESTPSVPPAPSARAVDVRVGDVRVQVGSSVTRKLLPWLAPVAISIAGAVLGYFQGLKLAGERMAAAEERTRQHGEKLAALQSRIVAQEEALAAEAASNRSERATRDRQINAIEDRLPKQIQGIPPPK